MYFVIFHLLVFYVKTSLLIAPVPDQCLIFLSLHISLALSELSLTDGIS